MTIYETQDAFHVGALLNSNDTMMKTGTEYTKVPNL